MGKIDLIQVSGALDRSKKSPMVPGFLLSGSSWKNIDKHRKDELAGPADYSALL